MVTDAPLDYYLRFNGSSVEVVGDGDTLVFELSHPEEIDCRSGVFAAWILLPLAMIKGRDIRIHAGGDEVTRQNFERLTEIWAIWMPERFRQAKVFFTEAYHPVKVESDTDILLFSGGVDSTYNLLSRHEAGKKQALLTIHGVDYKEHDLERYERLLKKTEPLVQMVGSRRVFLKTNAYAVYRQHQVGVDVGHAFVLAATLFLYGAKYRQGEISSDSTTLQDYFMGIWGTNAITNPLFESSSFKMNTANLDVTRAAKFPLIRKYPVALKALSFCKDYSFRPENCGVCRKCVRAKASFLVWENDIPAIFADMSFDRELFERKGLGETARLNVADFYFLARKNGTLGNLPWIREILLALAQPIKEKTKNDDGKAKTKKRTKKQSWYRRVFSQSTAA